MNNIASTAKFIEDLPQRWDLIDFTIDNRKNCLTISVQTDDRVPPWRLEAKTVIFEQLVDFQYTPHLTEPLPGSFYEASLEVVQAEEDLKPHEGKWLRGKSYYDAFLPFYRVAMVGWEFTLTIICRQIRIEEAAIEQN